MEEVVYEKVEDSIKNNKHYEELDGFKKAIKQFNSLEDINSRKEEVLLWAYNNKQDYVINYLIATKLQFNSKIENLIRNSSFDFELVKKILNHCETSYDLDKCFNFLIKTNKEHKMIEKFFEIKPDYRINNDTLILAISGGYVQDAILSRINPDILFNNQQLLIAAIIHNNRQIVDLLIKNNTSINYSDTEFESMKMRNGNPRLISYLKEIRDSKLIK